MSSTYCYELEAPEQQFERCIQLIKPGGLMSLLTKGKAGATARFIQAAEVQVAREVSKTGRCVNKLGVDVQAYSEEELTDLIARYGGTVKEWFGLHVTTDPMRQSASDFSKDELAEILAMEAALGARESVRGIGQMLHFLIQKHP